MCLLRRRKFGAECLVQAVTKMEGLMARFPGRSGFILGLALALTPALAPGGVMEGEPLKPRPAPEPVARSLTLPPGYATIYHFDSLVDTVVVGNTAVISAAVLDPQEIVLTALNVGRTNVIVLGTDGRTLARLFVRVRDAATDPVTLYNGSNRTLLVCEPDCVPLAEAEPELAAPPPPAEAQ